jgi:hypothetical protein
MDPNIPAQQVQTQSNNPNVEKNTEESIKPNPLFRFNKKMLIIFLLILLFVFSVGAFGYYLAVIKPQSVSPKAVVVPTKPPVKTALPTAINSPTPGDAIKWNPEVENISPSPTLSLIKSLADLFFSKTAADNSGTDITGATLSATLSGIQYYKVGVWQTGEYKGADLIDAVISIKYSNSAQANEYITRVSEHNNNLVIFINSSSVDIGFSDFKDKLPKEVVYDENKLPDLFYSYPVYTSSANGGDVGILFPITYLGKTKQFQFLNAAQIQDQFFTETKPGYKLMTTFSHGQKLFGRDPAINPATWSSIIGNPYYTQDLDYSFVSVDYNAFSSNNFSKNISWIKQPDLLTDVANYRQQYDPVVKTANDLDYSDMGFVEGCTDIDMDKMASGSMFDSNQMELVATSDTDSIYRPTNADTLLHFMYDYIAKQTPALTYERYVNSFPLLVYKDNFGTYQLMVRMDYPGHPEGCGKPVIYLYPTQKTDVKVSFSSSMSLTKTEPRYISGWNVTAYPDGTLINKSDGKIYPYLFWEGATANSFPKLNYGTVVKKGDVKNYLIKTLDNYGLTSKERNDFINYWLPYLSDKPYYLIRFYTTKNLEKTIPEYIFPKPDSILRLLMEYQGLDKPIHISPPPQPIPFQRKGFTVVEWGGIYGN